MWALRLCVNRHLGSLPWLRRLGLGLEVSALVLQFSNFVFVAAIVVSILLIFGQSILPDFYHDLKPTTLALEVTSSKN